LRNSPLPRLTLAGPHFRKGVLETGVLDALDERAPRVDHNAGSTGETIRMSGLQQMRWSRAPRGTPVALCRRGFICQRRIEMMLWVAIGGAAVVYAYFKVRRRRLARTAGNS
jgi:hypothetical protein